MLFHRSKFRCALFELLICGVKKSNLTITGLLEENMGRKKTWREKLENSKDLPRVEVITDKMSKRWGSGTIVIPAPKELMKL